MSAANSEEKVVNPLIERMKSGFFIMMNGRNSADKPYLLEQAIEMECCWVPYGALFKGETYPDGYSTYCDRIHAIALKARRGIVPGARAMQNLDKLRPDKDHSKLPQWIREAVEMYKLKK